MVQDPEPDSENHVPSQTRTESRTPYLVLAAIILWTFGCNLIWTILDEQPPSWDQAAHLRIALKYASVFSSGSERMWLDLLSVESFYPPVYHLSLLPVFAVFGFAADNAVIVNSFFLAVTLLAIYGIGRRLYDRNVGLLAAFLFACYPFPAYSARQCMIGITLTAVVTLSYYLFLRSNHFEDRKFSVLFALSYAVGLMVKWTFFLYLLPAVILGLWGWAHRSLAAHAGLWLYYLGLILATMVFPFLLFILSQGKSIVLLLEAGLVFALVRYFPRVGLSASKLIHILTLTLVSLWVCFPWYAHNLAKMAKGMSKFGFPDTVLKGDMEWNLPIWGYYLEAAGRQMGMPFFLLFVVGAIAFVLRKKHFNGMLFGWMAFSLIAFTLINNKGVRYTMPILPAAALVSALFLLRIESVKLRRAALAAGIVLGLFTYVYTGFLPGAAKMPVLGGPALGFKVLPVAERWQIDSILDDILEAASPQPGETVTVRTLTNHPWFHRGAFRDAAEIRGLPVVVKSVKRNLGELTDFFITKNESEAGESGIGQIHPKRDRLLSDPVLLNTFMLFKRYPLPNRAQALVLRRHVVPATGIEGALRLEEVERRFAGALSEYPIYGVEEAVNPSVRIVPTERPEDLALGRYRSITFRADSALSNKVRIEDIELTFEDVQISLYELFQNGKLILFEIGKLFPKGTVHFDFLEALAEKEMKGRGAARLQGEGDRLYLSAWHEVPWGKVEGRVSVRIEFQPGSHIRPVVESVVLGPVALKEIFYRRIVDEKIALTPTPGWPLTTDIRTLKIHPRKLEINPDAS